MHRRNTSFHLVTQYVYHKDRRQDTVAETHYVMYGLKRNVYIQIITVCFFRLHLLTI